MERLMLIDLIGRAAISPQEMAWWKVSRCYKVVGDISRAVVRCLFLALLVWCSKNQCTNLGSFLGWENFWSRANGSRNSKFLSMAKFPLTLIGPVFSWSGKFWKFKLNLSCFRTV